MAADCRRGRGQAATTACASRFSLKSFVPYTISMGMYTQILVRSEVSPLTLVHAIGAAGEFG